MRIAQLVPTLHSGDAIGNNARILKRFFLSSRVRTEIFYLDADPDTRSEGLPVGELDDWLLEKDDTIVILHYALPSRLNDIFRRIPACRILVYHNITPPEFLRGYPHLQHLALEGRRQLAALRDVPNFCVADSEFNRLELENLGFQETREIPILMDFTAYDQTPCPVISRMFPGEDIINFLFVGRITPSKCQHDVIRFYGYFKRYVNPRCRLILVGKHAGFDRYLRQCRKLADQLKLGDIHFTGKVTHAELLAYYRLADVFISMSEHEGFGVPLVEAMHMDVPVMAFSAAAVPYTMSGGGIVFHRKDNMIILSELAQILTEDNSIRTGLIDSQRMRLEYFSARAVTAGWTELLRNKTGIGFTAEAPVLPD